MNIKDFLIDNYIWIIVIILITIITIIGFLADKKRGNKKNEEVPPMDPNLNNTPQNNVVPMQYQQQNANMQYQMNNNNQVANNNTNNQQPVENQNMVNNQPLNNVANTMQSPNGMPNVIPPMTTTPTPVSPNMVNETSPIEVPTPKVSNEALYQPLSEQKPNIPPHAVPDFLTNNKPQETMMPVDSTLNNNPIQMGMNPQNMQQPMGSNNGLQGSMPNYSQEGNAVPNPVNQIHVPKPVVPTPIMTNNNVNPMNYNNNQPMQMGIRPQNMQQPINTNQNMGMQPQMNNNMGMNSNHMQPNQPMNNQMPQNNPSMQSPINFVFGPQNNNPNM